MIDIDYYSRHAVFVCPNAHMRQTLLLLLPRCFITIQVLLPLLFYSSVVL